MNQLMNDGGDCRTTPATPGLLISLHQKNIPGDSEYILSKIAPLATDPTQLGKIHLFATSFFKGPGPMRNSDERVKAVSVVFHFYTFNNPPEIL